jgi:L-threonylcarbamoyladenylate synthase
LARGPLVPASVTAGLPAVGVRVPAHPVALALIRAAGVPIAAPSANPYTWVSPTTAAHVQAGLGDKVDLILDGGPAAVGLESTVLDLTGAVPRVLRPGGLSLERLRALLGEVVYEPITKAEDVALPSPGLAKRHYAPRARVQVLPLEALLLEASRLAGRVGSWTFGPPPGEGVVVPREPAAYAARLYAGLHEADRLGWEHLLIEAPPRDDAWAAVHDRLKRAASS